MRKLRNIFFAAILISVTNNIAHAADIDYAKEIAIIVDIFPSANAYDTNKLQKQYPCLGEDFKSERLKLFKEGGEMIFFNDNFAKHLEVNATKEDLESIYKYLQSSAALEYLDDLHNPKFNQAGDPIFPSIEKNTNPNLTKLATLSSAWLKSEEFEISMKNKPAFNLNGLAIKRLPSKYLVKDEKTNEYKCK